MSLWNNWKKGFDVWERATADFLEGTLRDESVLGPSGAMLTAAMKMKTMSDKAMAAWWGGIGLPTKRDQERALHKIDRLETRILDLEEQLISSGVEIP